jgi:hypothetical protein
MTIVVVAQIDHERRIQTKPSCQYALAGQGLYRG